MKVRVPLQTVVVFRDKVSVTPPIGQPFEFEDSEVEDIERMNPDALGKEASVDLSAADAKTEGKAVKGAAKASTEPKAGDL